MSWFKVTDILIFEADVSKETIGDIFPFARGNMLSVTFVLRPDFQGLFRTLKCT